MKAKNFYPVLLLLLSLLWFSPFVFALEKNAKLVKRDVPADTSVPVPDDVFLERAKQQLKDDFAKAADLKAEIVKQMEAILNHRISLGQEGTIQSDAKFEAAYAEALDKLDDRVAALLKVRVRIDENLHLIERALLSKQKNLAKVRHKVKEKGYAHRAKALGLKSQAKSLARQYEYATGEYEKQRIARAFLSVMRQQEILGKYSKVYEGAIGKIDRVIKLYTKLPQGIENLRLALKDQFFELELAHGLIRDTAELQKNVVEAKIILAKTVSDGGEVGQFVSQVVDLRKMSRALTKVTLVDPEFTAFNKEFDSLLKVLEFDESLSKLSSPEGRKAVEQKMKQVLDEDDGDKKNKPPVSYRRIRDR